MADQGTIDQRRERTEEAIAAHLRASAISRELVEQQRAEAEAIDSTLASGQSSDR